MRQRPSGQTTERGPVARALLATVQPAWKLAVLVAGFGLAYLLLGLYGALFMVAVFFGGQLGLAAWEAREARLAAKPTKSSTRTNGIQRVIRSTPRGEDRN